MKSYEFWRPGQAVILTIICSLIILKLGTTEAQSNPNLIIEMDIFTNYRWSADSQAFVFQDGMETGVNTSLNTWYQYDVRSGSLSQFANWPLQPSLTGEQIQTFQIASDLEGYLSFVYRSPNGRYIVYKTQLPQGYDALYTAAIADLQTNTYRQLLPIAFNSLNHINLQFNVIWSEDSSGFVLQNLTSFGSEIRNYSFSNFQDSLDNLSLQEYTLVNIAGSEVKAEESHDISDNGRYILFESSSANLMLWDREVPENSREIADSQIDTAIFTIDESYILFLGNEGWMAYEFATGRTSLISSATNARLAEYAAISPDGRYLAWVEGEQDNYRVYILEQNQIVSGDFILSDFTILAQDGLLLQQGVFVDNGNVGVNTAGKSPFLSSNSTLTIGQGVQFLDSNPVIYGDSIHLNQDTQVYDFAYNSLTGVGICSLKICESSNLGSLRFI